MKSRVNSAVARSNIGLLVLCLVLLIPLLYVASVSTVPYFRAKFGGGRVFTGKELAAYKGSLPLFFAKIDGVIMVDTGYYRGSNHYGALAVGTRFLLVEFDGDVTETKRAFSGTLDTLGQDGQDEVISMIESDEPKIRGEFLPFFMRLSDAEGSGINWYVGAIALFGTIIACAYGLVRLITRVVQPARHPIWKRLARYGMNPDDLLTTIEMDVQQGSSALGKMTVSRNWIVYGQATNFNVMKVEDISWMYMQVVTRRAYGIRVGRNYTAFLWDQYGVSIQSMDKEARVQEILGGIAQRAPWASMGYTADLNKLWRKDRAAFLQQVSERKRQMMRG